jgi:hypothetical protein
MGRKGRRGRSKKTQAPAVSVAAATLDESPATLPCAGVSAGAPIETQAAPCPPAESVVSPPAESIASCDPPEAIVASPAPEATVATAAEATAASAPAPTAAESRAAGEPSPPVVQGEPAHLVDSTALAGESQSESEAGEESVPPIGDLDARFFMESSSEAWLAHELELRDPRFVRKMTASVARRRAHLARYVVGVVGVAVALCLAALIKSAVPGDDDESRGRPAAQMAMPAAEAPLPTLAPAPSAAPAVEDGVDGGGG